MQKRTPDAETTIFAGNVYILVEQTSSDSSCPDIQSGTPLQI